MVENIPCDDCGSLLYVDGACPVCTCHKCDEHYAYCECETFENLRDKFGREERAGWPS